jgi:hypothetical protein
MHVYVKERIEIGYVAIGKGIFNARADRTNN